MKYSLFFILILSTSIYKVHAQTASGSNTNEPWTFSPTINVKLALKNSLLVGGFAKFNRHLNALNSNLGIQSYQIFLNQTNENRFGGGQLNFTRYKAYQNSIGTVRPGFYYGRTAGDRLQVAFQGFSGLSIPYGFSTNNISIYSGLQVGIGVNFKNSLNETVAFISISSSGTRQKLSNLFFNNNDNQPLFQYTALKCDAVVSLSRHFALGAYLISNAKYYNFTLNNTTTLNRIINPEVGFTLHLNLGLQNTDRIKLPIWQNYGMPDNSALDL